MKHLKLLCTCAMLLLSTVAFAQSRITGNVSDSQGEPIIGGNVMVKGTMNGTITNLDGDFTLEVTEGNTLVVSYIGYKTLEVPIGEKTTFRIVLSEDTEMLDEVVVVGYGVQSKRNVTGAISSVQSASLTRSSSTTVSGALAGKVQGVSTKAADARPGRGIKLEIRNMGNPLFVIDGIPYGGETGVDWVQGTNVSGNDVFNSLSLEDIESISILKDASAAIYGLRAANGVVLVTTKKGKRDETVSVNVNGYYGWQNLTKFPTLANAYQYRRAQLESAGNLGASAQELREFLSPEDLAKWKAGTEDGYKSYDYYDIIMRKNIPQYHINANVTGGSKSSNYYISVSHTSQEALIKDFNYERTNFQANIETNITKAFKVGAQVSAKHELSQDVGLPGGDGYFAAVLAMFSQRPYESPYANDNPNYINHTQDYSHNPALFSRDIAGYKDNLTRNANLNMYAQYDFGFGLTAKATVSYNYTNTRFDGFQYTYNVYTYDSVNDEYNKTEGSNAGWRYQTDRDVVAKYGQFQLNYDRQFGDHYLAVVAAYEASDYDKAHKVYGTVPPTDYLPLLNQADINSFDDLWSYEARAGYIGRINYNYQNKYLVEVLGRYDGSYLYAPGKRWGFFPAASLGWRISEESFFEPLRNVVSDLKIRGSIGQTGSENGVSMFGYLSGYDYNNGDAVLNGSLVTGIKPRGLPVTNLSWEKNTSSNVGMDFALFNNKLTGTVDFFQKRISGVPAARYDVVLPGEVGYNLPNENLNVNAYRGAEWILTYTDHVGELNYSVSGNFTYSRYRNVSTYKPRFGSSWDEYKNSKENRFADIWWGYQVIGQFQSQEEIDNYPVDIDGQNNRTLLPGDFIFKDVNGDGIINSMDERPIGYPENWAPFISFGGNIGLEWKGIDVNMDFSGAAMQNWVQDYELRNPLHNGYNSPAYLLEDRWHRADPYDPNSEWIPGYYPAIRQGSLASNSRNSDFWVHNVRYLRLKNLEIGYTFPRAIIGKIGAQKVRIYTNISNVFTISNVNKFEIDPEIEARAAVVYPQQRTVLIGFNVTF